MKIDPKKSGCWKSNRIAYIGIWFRFRLRMTINILYILYSAWSHNIMQQVKKENERESYTKSELGWMKIKQKLSPRTEKWLCWAFAKSGGQEFIVYEEQAKKVLQMISVYIFHFLFLHPTLSILSVLKSIFAGNLIQWKKNSISSLMEANGQTGNRSM